MTTQQTEIARYRLDGGLGWIDIDDGGMNLMSPNMQASIGRALDQAEADDVVTVLRGREGVFSAGFDLGILRQGNQAATHMVLGGFELARRVLAHPRPVLVACTGHAIAMGAFLVLSGDYRLGVRSKTKVSANEVAIGLTMPRTATELLRQRLTPAAFQRAILLAQPFEPDAAASAGFLDEVVEPEAFDARVLEIATGMMSLDRRAQVATKARTREPLLAIVDAAIEADRAEYAARSA